MARSGVEAMDSAGRRIMEATRDRRLWRELRRSFWRGEWRRFSQLVSGFDKEASRQSVRVAAIGPRNYAYYRNMGK